MQSQKHPAHRLECEIQTRQPAAVEQLDVPGQEGAAVQRTHQEKGRRHPIGQRQQKLRAGCSQVRFSNFFSPKQDISRIFRKLPGQGNMKSCFYIFNKLMIAASISFHLYITVKLSFFILLATMIENHISS